MSSIHPAFANLLRSRLSILSLCLVLTAIITTLLPTPTIGANERQVTVGVLAFRERADILRHWQAVIDYLNQSLPAYRFELQAHHYSGLEQAIRKRQIDLLLTNPSHYIDLAHNISLSAPTATLVRQINGAQVTGFGGTILVRADVHDIDQPTDLAGRRIAAISKHSLGGYQAQLAELVELGVDPGSIDFLFTDTPHDRAIDALLAGEAEAAFVRAGVLESYLLQRGIDRASFRVLNQQAVGSYPFALSTRIYPEWPLVAMPHLNGDLVKQVVALLFDYNNPQGRIAGFTIPAIYEPVDRLMRTLRQPPYDNIPTFTWSDVWSRFGLRIGLAAALGLLMLLIAALYLIGYSRYLRERERNRQQGQLLKQSERRYRAVVNALSEGVVMLNDAGLVITCNDAASRILALDRSRLLGSTGLEEAGQSIDEDGRPLAHDNQPGAVTLHTGDAQHDRVIGLKRHDGQLLWLLVNTRPLIEDHHSGDVPVVISFVDITARRQAEQEVANSRELYALAVEGSNDGIWDWNLVRDQLYFSPRWKSMIGYADNELSDTFATFESLLHEEDRQRVLQEINDYLCQQGEWRRESFSTEFRMLHKKGTWRWILGRGVARWDRDGHPYRMAGSHTDITERKLNEEAMRRQTIALQERSEALSRSNADLEHFAYAISHDMRQPLRMVTSYLQLLSKSLAGSLDDEQASFISYATDGAKRMDSMIVSLLDYSRVGRKNDPKKMVASRDALDEALDFLEPTILDRHAEIVVSGRWPLLVASYDELVRLFQNLVGNAIKYTPLNRSPWVAIDSDHNDQSWHISVRDHGIGFEMSQSGRLFQIFSRIEHRSEYEGNGVGLALCRKIIEHHGGEIGCESAGTDRGSHFHFTLPLDGGEPPS